MLELLLILDSLLASEIRLFPTVIVSLLLNALSVDVGAWTSGAPASTVVEEAVLVLLSPTMLLDLSKNRSRGRIPSVSVAMMVSREREFVPSTCLSRTAMKRKCRKPFMVVLVFQSNRISTDGVRALSNVYVPIEGAVVGVAPLYSLGVNVWRWVVE